MERAAQHSAILVAAFAVMSLTNYAFGVALSWFFPPGEYGVLGVAQSLLLLLALAVGSGFTWTAAHDLASQGITDETRRRFRSAWSANVLLGALLGAMVWAAYAAGWLDLGPAYREIVPLVALTTVLLAARSVVNGAVRGMYRFSAVALNTAGEVLVKAAIGLALVAMGLGAEAVLLGFVVGAAAALAHSLWVARSARLWLGPGWFDWSVVLAAAPLFIAMLGPALMLNLDLLGLKLLAPGDSGDQLAGYYQAAVILARTPVFIAQSLTMVLFSYVAGAARDSDEPARYIRAATRAWARLLLPASLVLVLAPEAALLLFFPERYQQAALALRISAAGSLLLALVTLFNGMAQASGNRRAPAIAATLAVSAQALVLVWAVPAFGVAGAALSLLVAGLVALVGTLPALAPRLRPHVLAGDLLRSLPPLLVLAGVLLLLPEGGRLLAAVKLGAAALIYLLALTAWRLRHRSLSQPELGPERRQSRPLMTVVQLLLGG